jgi:hypothetical protein
MSSYDIIIVGAGISGLYAAREILKRNPSWRVAIAEKYKSIGGRTSTFHKGQWQWEAGAGRVHRSHKMTLGLLKEYGLNLIPLGTELSYKPIDGPLEPDVFESAHIPLFLEPLSQLSPDVLANHTIEDLLTKVHGSKKTKEILDPFPYRAEVNTLRADLGLHSFLDGEMKGHEGFFVVKEGFSELIDRMRTELEDRGCKFLVHHKLVDISKPAHGAVDCKFIVDKKEKILHAERSCFLTLCRCHVAVLPFLQKVPILSHVIGRPLLRVYMVFKVKPSGKVWFHDLGNVVTPMRPRYIIPINAEKGIIMISYTDADDTHEYRAIYEKGGDDALEKVILSDIQKVFPERSIPNPVFTKAHMWGTGASYWVPGNYDPEKMSVEAMTPLSAFPNLHMCGESWSMRQAWVEGALEHTRKCLDHTIR